MMKVDVGTGRWLVRFFTHFMEQGMTSRLLIIIIIVGHPSSQDRRPSCQIPG
jgi:hypothetical protein